MIQVVDRTRPQPAGPVFFKAAIREAALLGNQTGSLWKYVEKTSNRQVLGFKSGVNREATPVRR